MPRSRLVRVGRFGKRLFWSACCAGAFNFACNGWDPRRPFERESPEVDQAVHNLDAGKPESAERLLESYLGTGACADAGLAVPEAARQKSNGAFDLGLTLFYLAERFGVRFGDEETDAAFATPPDKVQARLEEIDCALSIVRAIANDRSLPLELRARAYYLAGNLEMMRRNYEEAVKEFDRALELIPGLHEEAGGDAIGRDAAHNRAIALDRMYRIVEGGVGDGADGDGGDSGDADADTGSGDAQDGDADGPGDSGGDSGSNDAGDGGPRDGKDAGDAGLDAGDAGKPDDKKTEDGGPPQPDDNDKKPEQLPAPSPLEEERILDKLEQGRFYQQELSKNRGRGRHPNMEDK